MKELLFLLGLLICANVQAGDVYRSIDAGGKVHYSDIPLSGSDDVEQLNLGSAPKATVTLPYETQVAMKNFPVTLYTFPGCGSACDKARALLTKRGVPYTEKSLVKQEDIDAFRNASGDSQMPAASIGETWLKGFLAEQWNNELDIAGYPKTDLSYHPPVPPAAPAAQPAQ